MSGNQTSPLEHYTNKSKFQMPKFKWIKDFKLELEYISKEIAAMLYEI